LTANRLTLAIRVDDLEWGRSSSGYLTPQPDDIAVDGQPIDEATVQSADFSSIFGTDKMGVSAVRAWQLQLALEPPADPTQPLTVTIDTLRFAPNRNIPDLPDTIDGDWSFTFVPATS
jgi:hypothetical protein